MSERIQVRRALISVFDKTGLEELVRALVEAGAEIVSSGGTATSLREAGFEVTDVSDVTSFPEMLDGRVKTLHPKLHGGILADRSKSEHMATIGEHGIEPIDLVVCNLYPFDKKVTSSSPDEEAVPLIDVGGPSMIRAAAKNHASVGVLVDASDYTTVIAEIADGGLTFATRRALAGKAFSHLSGYDAAISEWFAGGDALPSRITVSGELVQTLRYGENPHQPAALYRRSGNSGVASGEQLQGKELSYINYLDLDAAFRLTTAFSEPAACIIKHTNPCGAATGADIDEAYRLAYECDTRAAFGGIVGLNRPLTVGVAEQMRELFLECIVAPDFEPDAMELLRKKRNLRLLKLPTDRWTLDANDVKSVSGGFLVQATDPVRDDRSEMRTVTTREPSEAEWADLLFAWTVAARVKSNSIVLAVPNQGGRQAIGVGAGQMSRVEAFEIAIRRAGERGKGAVAASDALLPFPDNVEVAAAAGVTAIIQPGGSVKDDEVVAAADAAGIAMVFTGKRHFWH